MPKLALPLAILTLLLACLCCPLTWLAEDAPILPTLSPILPQPTATHDLSIPNATIEWYDIQGSTSAELRQQVDTYGPVDDNGERWEAMTYWEISWNWPGYGSADCNLSQATVSYENTVILPRWNPPPEAAPQLIERWNAYLPALARHEQNHVEIVLAHYQEVLSAIQSADCLTADSAARAAFEEIRRLQNEYDDASQHGANEGIYFP